MSLSLNSLVSFSAQDIPIDWNEEFGRKAPLEVEIGFGNGEVLVQKSFSCAERNFIGIEQKAGRIKKTLRRIEDKNREISQEENIKILRLDARVAFQYLFSAQSVAFVYCLFPCPWPKKKQIKYRLFSRDFLALLNSRLTKSGKIQIVTDQENFRDWIKDQIDPLLFDFKTQTIVPQFGTKFEQKWIGQGQSSFFEITLKKIRHHDVVSSQFADMKTYYLENFNKKKFILEDIRNYKNIAISFKEINYDSQQKRCLVPVIVVEAPLSQYVWVEIKKAGDTWRVGFVKGQNFFSTSGVAYALEVIYEAVKKSVA